MNRMGFAPSGGDLTTSASWLGEPTSGDWNPGDGLSIDTRTNDIATTAAGWHAARGSGFAEGGIGYGGAADSYGSGGSGFDTSMGIFSGTGPSNLSSNGDDSPGSYMRASSNGADRSAAMDRDNSGFLGDNPILTLILAFAAIWIVSRFFRTAHGHGGEMRIGPAFLLIEIPIIMACIWIWRWLGGVGVSHNVPGSATLTAFFAS